LRHQVDRLGAHGFVAALAEAAEVARQRHRVAADVDDALRLDASATNVGARDNHKVLGDGCEALIAALYRDDGIEYLAKRPDEVLVDIHLPPADGIRSVYLKLRRRGAFDFPVLGVAAALQMDGDRIASARIVLGAVASLPREAAEAAGMLAGQRLEPDLIAAVAERAARPSKPLDNTDLTHPYRKKMSRVYVERALRRLAGLADGGRPDPFIEEARP